MVHKVIGSLARAPAVVAQNGLAAGRVLRWQALCTAGGGWARYVRIRVGKERVHKVAGGGLRGLGWGAGWGTVE